MILVIYKLLAILLFTNLDSLLNKLRTMILRCKDQETGDLYAEAFPGIFFGQLVVNSLCIQSIQSFHSRPW